MSIFGTGKDEADGFKKLEVSFLRKNGYFKSGWKYGTVTWSRNGQETGNISIQSCINSQEQYIRLIYTSTDKTSGKKTECNYKVPLVTTPCYFGGKRYWFKCSLSKNTVYCGRRVGVLYSASTYFACRHCYDLTYASRNLSGISKMSGTIVSEPELEEMYASIKSETYAGKPTRRYKRYLKKLVKSRRQWAFMIDRLGGGIYRK